MHKTLFGLLPLLLIPLLVVSINAQIDPEPVIPSWIKVVADAWANDGITDSEYRDAMGFLIEAGIIQIDTVQINEITLSDETERLYQLEINQKEDRINILENEVEGVGLDNSDLLNSIVNLQDIIVQRDLHIVELEQNKSEKVGNIGEEKITPSNTNGLEERIEIQKTTIKELEEKIIVLLEEIEDLK